MLVSSAFGTSPFGWLCFASLTLLAAVAIAYFPTFWRSKAASLRDNRPLWFPGRETAWLRYLRGYSGAVVFLPVCAALYLPLALIETDDWPGWLAAVASIVFFGSMVLAVTLYVFGRPEALVPPALRRDQTRPA